MPFGGLKEAASGADGGNSGSGCKMGRPLFGDLRCLLPKNESASSSPSGAGGGNGLGLGLKGDLVGIPARLLSACSDEGNEPGLCVASLSSCTGSLASVVVALADLSTASRAPWSLAEGAFGSSVGGADCVLSNVCGCGRTTPAFACAAFARRLARALRGSGDVGVASLLLLLPMLTDELRGETRRLFDAGPSIAEETGGGES